MKTAAGIATGYADNLLLRAADVTLKERRRLVLVPRETPLSPIHLRNLLTLSELGAVILPPVLTFYNKPAGIEDMTRHIVGRILDVFDLELPGFRRWGDAWM
jgi:4-hydroxy-3-polyprenylbenzoate decarboxylase